MRLQLGECLIASFAPKSLAAARRGAMGKIRFRVRINGLEVIGAGDLRTMQPTWCGEQFQVALVFFVNGLVTLDHRTRATAAACDGES